MTTSIRLAIASLLTVSIITAQAWKDRTSAIDPHPKGSIGTSEQWWCKIGQNYRNNPLNHGA